MSLHRFYNSTNKPRTKRTRRCWFVGCDITQSNQPEDVKLVSLPKQEPKRTKWWLRMGHRRFERIPTNAKCCSRHLNMAVQKKFQLPIVGIANAIHNTSRRVGAANMDAASVAQRRADHQEAVCARARDTLKKKIIDDMKTDPETMATKYVELLQKMEKLKVCNDKTCEKAKQLEAKLECMAPSKLSTLTDEWVNAYTPFRRKVFLVGFLIEMVLPHIQHVWGYAGLYSLIHDQLLLFYYYHHIIGFKDEHDRLRRNREADIEDASSSPQDNHVANTQLEKERQRIHRLLSRRYKKKKQSRKKLSNSGCSYADCTNGGDSLIPCEQTGLCPRLCHLKCFRKHSTGSKILCSECNSRCSQINRKRDHGFTPPCVARSTRSVSKSRRVSTEDPVRVCLFPNSESPTSSSPVQQQEDEDIVIVETFDVDPDQLPITPEIEQLEDENITPPPTNRPGRGGPGRCATSAYVAGSGAIPDPFQKKYNTDSNRATVREFDVKQWVRHQRRKARAVDHFFAVAQKEKHVQDCVEDDIDVEDIDEAFGTEMPEQQRYKYRGHTSCNMLQEILITLNFLKKAAGFDDLASKWLSSTSKVAQTAARNICITWVAVIYEIGKSNPMWISPERADKIRPSAFQVEVADNVGHLSDCTNLDLGNCARSNPLASSLLSSHYYKGICVKYLIDISRCGGVCAVSCSHGGSKASDQRLMESAGYFDPSRCQWRYRPCPRCEASNETYCKHKTTHGFLYDGGVDMSTVGKCDMFGFRCVKTGTKRTDAKSTLSWLGKTIAHLLSILRIRVENKIGDGKGVCKILDGRRMSIDLLAIVHKIIFVCWYLMNFNFPTIL